MPQKLTSLQSEGALSSAQIYEGALKQTPFSGTGSTPSFPLKLLLLAIT